MPLRLSLGLLGRVMPANNPPKIQEFPQFSPSGVMAGDLGGQVAAKTFAQALVTFLGYMGR